MPVTFDESLCRLDTAKSDRYTFDNHWQEAADLCLPTRDFIRQRVVQGEQRNTRIYNETAPNAVDSLAAAIHFLLTNPSDRWVQMSLEDFDADAADESARQWLYDSTNRLLTYLASPVSGFPTAAHEIYLDLAAFGSACCQGGPPRGGRLRFIARALAGTYYLDDDEGEISDVFRCTDVRLRDLARQFGDAISPTMRSNAADPKGGEQKLTLCHHVWNRGAEADPYSVSNLDMQWGSRYFLSKGATGGMNQDLSVSGFKRNPYITPRWSKAADETYGRGPALSVLPAIKGVNAMSRDQLIAGAMRTRPPINVWDASLKRKQLDTSPGAVNWLLSTTRNEPTAMQTGADPSLAEGMIERTEARIEKAFYLDTMEIPLVRRSHSAMTAEEIIARRQQALARASPVVSRLQAEWCQPVVATTLFHLWETKQLLPVPSSLRGRSIKPVFTSPMAMSQRQREAQSITDALQQAGPLLATDPSVVLNIDSDRALRLIWNYRNADPRVLRRPTQVRQMREAQQIREQAPQTAQVARDLAAASKDVGGSVPFAG